MDSGGEESGDKTSVRSLEDAEEEDRGLILSCPMTERWSSCERSLIFAGATGHSSAIAKQAGLKTQSETDETD